MRKLIDKVSPRFEEIKAIYKRDKEKYGNKFPIGGELDMKAMELIEALACITISEGSQILIEGMNLDFWKNRVWIIVENAGLLAELPGDVDDEIMEEYVDDYNTPENEHDCDWENEPDTIVEETTIPVIAYDIIEIDDIEVEEETY
jgi:hypothetical protein